MKKVISIVLTLAMIISSFTVVFAADEIIISSVDDLKAIAAQVASDGGVGKYYKLNADLNLGGMDWNDYMIGSPTNPFKGTFDGNGKYISNFKFNVPVGDYKEANGNELDLGLFAAAGGDAVIKNLGLTDVKYYSTASWGYNARAGALVAKLVDNAKVDSCFVRGVVYDVKSGESSPQMGEAGGLIGYLNGAGVEVTNCYSTGYSVVNNCIANPAALIGFSNSFSKIENCYAEGSVSAVVTEKTADVKNSFSTTAEWCIDTATRVGTMVTAEQLKGKAADLGTAFKDGTNYNNGFPVLAWEPAADAITGTGTEADPYIISSKATLVDVSIMEDTAGKYFKLNEDIDLYDTQWSTYIGSATKPFEGIFDGNGHTIKNLWVNVPAGNFKEGVDGELNIGVFGVVGGNGVIKNLAVENMTATSGGSWGYNAVVGGMVGKLTGSATVDRCYARNITADTKNVNVGSMGGLIGLVSGDNATVSNCYALEFTEIGDCVSTEDGFIGRIDNAKSVVNCYSATTFAAVITAQASKVTNCYTIGNAGWAPSGYTRAGEIVTVSKLKASAYVLGDAFKEGGEETFGFPALVWQTVTPIKYVSNDTDVPSDKVSFVYECEFDYAADDKISFYFENKSGSFATELITIEEGKILVANYNVDDVTAGAGKYKLTILHNGVNNNTLLTLVDPDGAVLRRGDSDFTIGLSEISRIVARVYGEENIISRAEIVAYPEYTAKPFTLIPEPTYTGFDANVYNLITSTDTDPKTTRTFAWTSVEGFDRMEVQYAIKGTDGWSAVPAIAEEVVDEYYQGVNYFKADLTGLSPGVEYVYKIGKTGSADANDWSKEYTFKTEDENVTDFKFVAFSDTQGTTWDGGDVSYTQATLQTMINDVPDTAFILNCGDHIQDASNDAHSWDLYLKALKGVVETIPHYGVTGNHDIWKHIEGATHLGLGENMLLDLHFNHPNNGGTAAVDPEFTIAESNIGIPILFKRQNLDETIYSFDYGNAHFVVLNSGGSWGMDTDDVRFLEAQKEWLKQDLAASDAKWKIFIMHRPVYASSKPVYDNLVFGDVFQEYGVDLILHGDEHWTARSYQIDNETIVPESMSNVDLLTKGKGSVYSLIGSVKTYGNYHSTNHGTFHKEMFLGNGTDDKIPVYATFEITDEKIEVTHKQIDGMIVDNFTIIAEDADVQVVRVSQFDVAVKEMLQLTPGYKAKADTNGEASIIVGYYNADGRLLYTQVADANNEFVVLDKEGVDEIRLFALDSTDNLRPLSKAYSLK